MTTQVSGTTGVSKVQDGVVVQADLAANVAGTGPAFSTVFTGTTVNPTVLTEMTTNTKEFDTANAMSSVSGRFQPAVAGYYQLNAFLSWGAFTSGGPLVQLAVNGVVKAAASAGSVDTHSYKQESVSFLVYLNGTTDYASVMAYAASTAATVTGGFSGFLARAA